MRDGLFLDTLSRLGPEQTRQGAVRSRRPLARVGPWPRPGDVALVAGTNGKGSTCFYLGALLEQAGKKPLVYLSPHLRCPGERFMFGGQPVALAVLDKAAARLLAHTGPAPDMSFFEYLTALAPIVMTLLGADTLVLEAGLGGNLDATNHLPHRWCLLTGVARDHAEVLGHSQRERLVDKLGIVGQGARVFTGPLSPPLSRLAGHTIAQGGGRWLGRSAEVLGALSHPGLLQTRLQAGEHRLLLHHDYPPLVQAAALALLAARDMAGPDLPRELALTRHLPGRCEFLNRPGQKFPLVRDVGHNPQAAAALGRYLRGLWRGEELWLAFALLRRKEAAPTVAALCQHLRPQGVLLAGRWLTGADPANWHNPARLQRLFEKRGVAARVVDSHEEHHRLMAGFGGPVALTGGFQFLSAWETGG